MDNDTTCDNFLRYFCYNLTQLLFAKIEYELLIISRNHYVALILNFNFSSTTSFIRQRHDRKTEKEILENETKAARTICFCKYPTVILESARKCTAIYRSD